jgi:large subunit ribosomal protein L9
MATQIHVVLQEDVDNLGTGGSVVRVRPGFARNYLIPRGLALPATKGNLARVEELRRISARKADAELASANELKGKLEAISVKVERAVGDDGRMYGSVTAKDIEEAYAAHKLNFDRKKLQLAEPIKALGLSDVPVKLHAKVTATLRVEVIKASS